MVVCELCSCNESCGYFVIRDSHVLDNRVTKMWLCYWCAKDLKEVHGVRLTPLKGTFKPQRATFPIKQKVYPAIPT